MQKPSVRRSTFPKHPQPHTLQIDGGVVIARDLLPIPPAGLDALGLAHQAQQPATVRQAILRSEQLRYRQKPQGPPRRRCLARHISGATVRYTARGDRWRRGRCPGAFGPVFLTQRKTMDRLRPQARAQAIDETTALLTRFTAVLTGLPEAAPGRPLWQQLICMQLARAYRCRQLQRIQALAE